MPPTLFVLRHGRSLANERGIIACSMDSAGSELGLTDEGGAQVRETIERERDRLADPVLVFTSPLLRARETAGIVDELLGTSAQLDGRLIERDFGELDLEPDSRYEEVWEIDRRDPTHRSWRVESVAEVSSRVLELCRELVVRAAGSVVLVTHGDVASTLLCLSMDVPLNRHREVGGMATGELREVDWPPGTTPPIFGPESTKGVETGGSDG